MRYLHYEGEYNIQIHIDYQLVPPPLQKITKQCVTTALLLLFCCVVLVMEPKDLCTLGTHQCHFKPQHKPVTAVSP